MKKIALTVLTAAILAMGLLAQGKGLKRIQVINPVAGAQWLRGSVQIIRWTHSLNISGDVRIELHRENEENAHINVVFSTTNNNSFSWTVPATFLADGNYFIRVATLDGSVHGDSGVITIRFPRPGVTVTWPNGNETVTIGEVKAIRWTPEELPAGAKVDITLLREGVEARAVASGYRADTGNYPWPVSGEAGGGYKVRIRLQGNDAQDESNGSFSLVANAAAGDLELVRLSGEGGKVRAHLRSTFPSLMRGIIYEIKRPDWAPTRIGRFNLNVAFSEPGEKTYSLENILPTDLAAGGDIIHSSYEVTLDPDNIIAESNEHNNRKNAALCGHPVFPVIEKVFFGSQEAQRNQLLAVSGGGVVAIYDTPSDKRRNIRTPWEVFRNVRVLIRNYGWQRPEGALKISQIGVQRRPWSDDSGSGGYLPEYQDRQAYFWNQALPAGPDIPRTIESGDVRFFLDKTDILVEYIWEGDGAHTHMAVFRFPVSFTELIREYERTH